MVWGTFQRSLWQICVGLQNHSANRTKYRISFLLRPFQTHASHCPDHLVGLDTKLSSVVEPRLASLDVTLTGLEERVTKMEERADVINEVSKGLVRFSNLYYWLCKQYTSYFFSLVPLYSVRFSALFIMRFCWFEDLGKTGLGENLKLSNVSQTQSTTLERAACLQQWTLKRVACRSVVTFPNCHECSKWVGEPD